jgi:predicted nuclease of predicted toxin-antitoxin system
MTKIITDEELDKLPRENKNKVLAIREKYGDNKWWEAEDLRILAYYQLKEDVLITRFTDFHAGIELLLGRPVWTHEFAINRDSLIEDAEKAFALVQTGEPTETTPEYKAHKIAESMDSLRTFAERKKMKVIGIEVK